MTSLSIVGTFAGASCYPTLVPRRGIRKPQKHWRSHALQGTFALIALCRAGRDSRRRPSINVKLSNPGADCPTSAAIAWSKAVGEGQASSGTFPCQGPDLLCRHRQSVLGCITPVPPLSGTPSEGTRRRDRKPVNDSGKEAIIQRARFLASPDQPVGSRPVYSLRHGVAHTQPAGLGLHFVPALGLLTAFVPPCIGGVESARRSGWPFYSCFGQGRLSGDGGVSVHSGPGVCVRWLQGLSQSCEVSNGERAIVCTKC